MKSILPAALVGLGLVSIFFTSPTPSPEDGVKTYFQSSFGDFIGKVDKLKTAAQNSLPADSLRKRFRDCRLTYKSFEALLEYYVELDAPKFNGPPIDFVEEEDPNAYHQPQGLQVIEALLFPVYDTTSRAVLIQYLDMLQSLCEGLAAGPVKNFEPQSHVLEALTEETYRIIALGITGFDTPASNAAVPEAIASLKGIENLLGYYKPASAPAIRQARLAQSYLLKNSKQEKLNRLEFIRSFMDPLSIAISNLRQSRKEELNRFRYNLIYPSGSLFSEKNFRRDAYLFDDTITAARVELGRKFFNEPLLSATGKRSCASCHQPARGFTDGLPKALELDGHTVLARNSPTLLNAAFQHNLFYDSRQVSLDQLINEVLGNAREMHSGPDSAFLRITGDRQYEKLYSLAYPGQPGGIRARFAVNAISMYLRTLASYHSRFDQYMRGNSQALNQREIAGFNLFAGKAKCATCHFIPLFNGSKPPTYFYQESEVLGVPATTDTINATLDSDPGRIEKLNKPFLHRSFKTSTLRNVELTAPYMHNGVFPDLIAVLHFYNRGGGIGLGIGPENQTLSGDPLNLTREEQDNIVLFLKTLTDTVSYSRNWKKP